MKIIDSHTGGEPTRTIISDAPDLGNGSMLERRDIFKENFDKIRTALIHEPRGSEIMVGALLCEPTHSEHAAAVIFFNNHGYLGMCGHGMIGVAVTLFHMGKIGLGIHSIDTPVGVIQLELLTANRVRVLNVASYRYAKDISVAVDGYGQVVGDIAWGGNWFFLTKTNNNSLQFDNTEKLTDYTWKIRQALELNNISGKDGAVIDHIEFFAEPTDTKIADSRNFVLCPGKEYDRSPCGTGTSAKLACLYEDDLIKPGQIWRQQSVIGSIFEGEIILKDQQIIPQITGEAFVTLEAQVIFNSEDPFAYGV